MANFTTSHMHGINLMLLKLNQCLFFFQSAGVSAATGAGIPQFFEKVQEAREEFEKWVLWSSFSNLMNQIFFSPPTREYQPAYEKLKAEKEKEERRKQEEQLSRVKQDLQDSCGAG